MKKFLLYMLCFLSVLLVNGNLYFRIPLDGIKERVNIFLEYQKINNCFERLRGKDEMALKCWRDDELIDVLILIKSQVDTNSEVVYI